LVDKAERAVIVTGANSVKDGRIYRQAQRLPWLLGDTHLALESLAVSLQHERDVIAINHLLVLDDVGRLYAIDRNKGVTDGDVGEGRWGVLGNGGNASAGHTSSLGANPKPRETRLKS